MGPKQKTAALATILNTALTVVKFVTYGFTGSIAILAEAWHSFSDIATSALVWTAVSMRKRKAPEGKPRAKGLAAVREAALISTPEQKISFGIGVLLFFVALGLLRKVLYYQPLEIRYPLVSGLVFLGFSIASYVISRLETEVGKAEGSAALVSDGMHAKADMTASLLVGFSLILYRLGISIDRLAAALISLLIFSFSLETLVNLFAFYARGEDTFTFRYRSYEIVGRLFDRNTLRKGLTFLETRLHVRLHGSAVLRRLLRLSGFALLLFLLLLFASTCVVAIRPYEEGILERFGKPVNRGRPLQPGLHLKLPWPADRVVKIDARRIRQVNVGNITDAGAFVLIWTKKHGTEIPFLTGDNNFFYPYAVVHYRVKDIFDYRYVLKNPEGRAATTPDEVAKARERESGLIENVANRVLSELFSKNTFNDIVTVDRESLETEARGEIQRRLDAYPSGIEILTVNLKDMHPPVDISKSFEGVIAASQFKRQMINDAFGYRNKQLPVTRGFASEIGSQAHAYSSERTKKAEGEGQRFRRLLAAYRDGESVLSWKIYLENLRDALRNREKVLVDPRSGVPDLWLRLPGAGGFRAPPWQGNAKERFR